MSTEEIVRLMLMSTPIYGAVLCGLLMIKLAYRKESPLESKVLILATASYAGSAIAWLFAIFYFQIPEWLIVMNPFFALANMLIFVFNYHFIFEVTRVNEDQKFSFIHYLIPALIFFCLAIWSFMIPFEEQLLFVQTHSYDHSEDRIFNLLYFSANPILLISYNILYAIMSLYRAKRYRRTVVNFSADEQRGAIQWVYHLIIAMLVIMPILIGVFMLSGTVQTLFILLLVVFSISKYTILFHNIMLENFVIIRHNRDQEGPEMVAQTLNLENVRKLDAYMRREKPYLNSTLKITDLITDLQTNRTSLSILINKHYGMNFCRYINRFRLEEYNKLRANQANKHLLEIDLILMAGFSDWRGYQRVKKQENIVL